MGPAVLLPFGRKARWRFFRPEKSDGFGRVWTRELGYQRNIRPFSLNRLVHSFPNTQLFPSWTKTFIFYTRVLRISETNEGDEHAGAVQNHTCYFYEIWSTFSSLQYWKSQVEDEIRQSKSEKRYQDFMWLRRKKDVPVSWQSASLLQGTYSLFNNVLFLDIGFSTAKARVSTCGVNYPTKHNRTDLGY
jgi:hypothetical protein